MLLRCLIFVFLGFLFGCGQYSRVKVTFDNRSIQTIDSIRFYDSKDFSVSPIIIPPLFSGKQQVILNKFYGGLRVEVFFSDGSMIKTTQFGYYEPSFRGDIDIIILNKNHVKVIETPSYADKPMIIDFYRQ